MNNGLFGQQQFPPIGMPQQAAPDMSTMYPQGNPFGAVPQEMPMVQPRGMEQMPQNVPTFPGSYSSPEGTSAVKYSVGDPMLDKYINMFLS